MLLLILPLVCRSKEFIQIRFCFNFTENLFSMKNLALKGILAMIILSTIQCKTPETKGNCATVMCTMEFSMLTVSLKNKAGNFYNADKVETYTQAGKMIYSQTSPSFLPDSSYTVIDDNNLKDLTRNVNTELDFKIYKGGAVVKIVKYVVTADCCHISKVSGPDQIIIE